MNATGSLSSYVALDIETTGFSCEKNRVIEVCAIRMQNGAAVNWLNTLVNPCCKISDEITTITGINNEMVADSPLISEVMRHLIPFVGRDVVVGHNAPFDLGFLHVSALRSFQIEFEPYFIDTLFLSRGLFPDLPNHKLPTVAKRCNVEVPSSHRAMPDTVVTWRCYEYMKAAASHWRIALPPPTVYDHEEHYNENRDRKRYPDRICARYVKTRKTKFDPAHQAHGKRFVFTGDSDEAPRDDLMKMVVDVGGTCGDSVTKKTDYLVVCQGGDWSPKVRSTKEAKAMELNAQGCNIRVILDKQFFSMFPERQSND